MKNARSNLLVTFATILFTSNAMGSDTLVCRQSSTVSIDRYQVASPAEDAEVLAQDWIVNPEKGWRRSEISYFQGECETDNGYVVCRARDLAFGEATLSIHPDGTNFVVVYMDYGLGALVVVGKCSAT